MQTNEVRDEFGLFPDERPRIGEMSVYDNHDEDEKISESKMRRVFATLIIGSILIGAAASGLSALLN